MDEKKQCLRCGRKVDKDDPFPEMCPADYLINKVLREQL